MEEKYHMSVWHVSVGETGNVGVDIHRMQTIILLYYVQLNFLISESR